ncbi:MAG: TetR/AcrR family transcriptional regulator [Desulfuromonas sp.]|nr:MAG: TetR/AcrR family transcriptional regulator [Desulfuromonas sp.]
MRVTKEVKQATREKILRNAEKLFSEVGYLDTTTRQIAQAAGIAAGTLFNYFPSKETLAMSLLADAFQKGRQDFQAQRTDSEDLNEELFLLISSELRRLRPYRSFVAPVLESTMSIFAKERGCPEGLSTRTEHLAAVQQAIQNHGFSNVPEQVATTLYWSLYLGILAFWSGDDSRNQEQTLALIDYSLRVFTHTINDTAAQEV